MILVGYPFKITNPIIWRDDGIKTPSNFRRKFECPFDRREVQNSYKGKEARMEYMVSYL